MRHRLVPSLLASAALALPAAAAGGAPATAAPGAAPPDAARSSAYTDRSNIPVWLVAGESYRLSVTVSLGQLPPSEVEGEPARVQLKFPDGPWRTVGTEPLTLVGEGPDASRARAVVTYDVPRVGLPVLRAQARVDGEWLDVIREPRPVTVTRTGPDYRSRHMIQASSGLWVAIGANGRYGAWDQEPGLTEYRFGATGPVLGPVGDLVFNGGDFGDVARSVPITAMSDSSGGGESGRSIDLMDFRTGRTVEVARTLDDERLSGVFRPSVSSDGRTVAFADAGDRIVRRVDDVSRPQVYVARPWSGTVRHVGRGSVPDLSPDGTRVVWVHPSGQVRMLNLQTGRRSVVYAPRDHEVESLDLVDHASAVVMTRQVGDRERTAVRVDRSTGRVRVLGVADDSSASDDGRRVALLRLRPNGNRGDAYLWQAGRPGVVQVSQRLGGGRSGVIAAIDLDPGGRYLATALLGGSQQLVPGPGSGAPRYDLRQR